METWLNNFFTFQAIPVFLMMIFNLLDWSASISSIIDFSGTLFTIFASSSSQIHKRRPIILLIWSYQSFPWKLILKKSKKNGNVNVEKIIISYCYGNLPLFFNFGLLRFPFKRHACLDQSPKTYPSLINLPHVNV